MQQQICGKCISMSKMPILQNNQKSPKINNINIYPTDKVQESK